MSDPEVIPTFFSTIAIDIAIHPYVFVHKIAKMGTLPILEPNRNSKMLV